MALALYIAQTKAYTCEDILHQLSVNEALRLFRGLFLMESVPTSAQCKPVFKLYTDLVSSLEDRLNVSTWLTVIETCRHSKDGLSSLLKDAKAKFDEIYSPDMFNTESQ